jgi:hypothetical protein
MRIQRKPTMQVMSHVTCHILSYFDTCAEMLIINSKTLILSPCNAE